MFACLCACIFAHALLLTFVSMLAYLHSYISVSLFSKAWESVLIVVCRFIFYVIVIMLFNYFHSGSTQHETILWQYKGDAFEIGLSDRVIRLCYAPTTV